MGGKHYLIATLLALLVLARAASAHDMSTMGGGDMDGMSMHDMHVMHGDMKNMAMHMTWSDLRPANAADKARADEIVAMLQTVLAKYKDFHVADADGYKPFHPEYKKQRVVHFTNWDYAVKAQFVFNASQPTSLLYKLVGDNGYELIGAMYTAPRGWSEDRINERVPLSVARWHKHINLCLPRRGTDPQAVDWTKLGPDGSIDTEQDCDAAAGVFYPALYGWMVHVYPWETNPQEVWAH
jgi:hypothetical protein